MSKLTYSVVTAALACVLGACGGQPAAVPTPAPTAPPTEAPTATPAPTDTPVPTSTPPPATPTPASASTGSSSAGDGAVEQAIADGLAQVQNASAYRVELEMAATGNLGMGAPAQSAGGPVALITLAGDVVGEDSRLTLKGLFSAFLGANPDQGLELITVDGTSYVRGPAPLLGATEAQWYELPADGSSPASAVRSDQIVGGLVSADLDLSGFEAAGEETLDGQRCQVYVGDKEATTRAFEAVGDQGLPGPQSFEEVTRAELKFWICEDGYFHQLALDTEGVPEGQTEPVGYTLTMRLFDFDAQISVEAPADAAQLESLAAPGLPTPTP